MNTPHEGQMVAYAEESIHQYGHTACLDGHTAWIDDNGELHLMVSAFPGTEEIKPALWNFARRDDDFQPNTVYHRDDLPELLENSSEKLEEEGNW